MPVTSPREAALNIVRRLHDRGHVALFAGGCVRDMLLGRTPADYDVATDAEPDRIVGLFRRTRKVGEQFGVILVKQGRWWIEVARFRKDLDYTDGRHPTSVVFSSPQEDAQRRDFTINGMFFDPMRDEVIDYVGGRDDLARCLVRAIGQPEQRFGEDSLRMLRAVRFAAWLSFAIDPLTQAAIAHHAADITRVSTERIREELEKMLADANRARAVTLAADCGLLDSLWPDADWSPDRTRHAVDTLTHLPAEASSTLGLAGLLGSYPAEQVNRICRDLACSNRQRTTTVWLVDHQESLTTPEHLSRADLKQLMAKPAFADLLALFKARLVATERALEPYETIRDRADAIPADAVAPPPLLTGEDLIAMGCTPGPEFGPTLDAVYCAQLNEEIVQKEQACALARRLLVNRVEENG